MLYLLKRRYCPIKTCLMLAQLAGLMLLSPTIGATDILADFSRVGLSDGLSHANVPVILQDHHGFLWLGTRSGLNRYDGVRFETWLHDPSDPKSLSNDDISSIVEIDGMLWIGTWGGGLNRFDPETGSATAYKQENSKGNRLGNNFIHCLEQVDGQGIWMGTLDSGLGLFDISTGTTTFFLPGPEEEPGSQANRIWCMTPDPNGHLWVGTGAGLLRFDPALKSFMPVKASGNPTNDPSRMPIHKLMWDRKGKLRAVSSALVLTIEPESGEATTLFASNEMSEGETQDLVTSLYEDTEGHLWWGCIYSGLWMFDGRTLKQYRNEPTNPASLSSDFVRSLYEDRSGNLWIGTGNDGLNRLDLKPDLFRNYFHIAGNESTFPEGEISALAVDQSGVIWIGSSSDGVTAWDRNNNRFQHYENQPGNHRSLGHNGILCLMIDSQDRLWAGTYGGLSVMQNDDHFQRFRNDPNNPNSLISNEVHALLEDNEGTIWIGTTQGLSRYKDSRFQNDRYTADNPRSIASGQIYAIFQDSQATIWLGFARSGLQRFLGEGQGFEGLISDRGAPQNLASEKIACIAEAHGSLWIGTLGNGLERLDRRSGRFEHFLMKDGLPNNTIYAILADERGYLWLSTNRGLSRLDTTTRRFVNFSYQDGLQSNQFSIGASLKLSDGEMFFGGVDGLNAFSPAQMETRSVNAPIVLSSLKILGRRKLRNLTRGGAITLEHQENFLEFEFAALDLTRPENNNFTYQLEGIDPEWITNSRRPFAIYTDLPHGNYRFHLRGTNHDGIQSNEELELAITIKPPYYETWWAYCIYTIVSGLVLWAVFRFQRHRLRQRAHLQLLKESERMAVEANRTKSIFLAHMSHELRTPLSLIVGYSEMLEEDLRDTIDEQKPATVDNLADLLKIKSSANYQLNLVENLLELTKIEAQECKLFLESIPLAPMISEILHQLQPMVEQAGNELEVQLEPPQLGPMFADPTKLRVILMNLTSNANKYTHRGKILLRVSQRKNPNQTTFRVEDNGTGIDQLTREHLFDAFANPGSQAEGAGLGLYLSRHFVAMMGGRIGVESAPDHGSVFTVTLPTHVEDSSRKA